MDLELGQQHQVCVLNCIAKKCTLDTFSSLNHDADRSVSILDFSFQIGTYLGGSTFLRSEALSICSIKRDISNVLFLRHCSKTIVIKLNLENKVLFSRTYFLP